MGKLSSRFFTSEKGIGELKMMQNANQKDNVMEMIFEKDCDMED